MISFLPVAAPMIEDFPTPVGPNTMIDFRLCRGLRVPSGFYQLTV
jgi:hypothetical protein